MPKYWICEECGAIVRPDLNACPNSRPHLHGLDPLHQLVPYVPEKRHVEMIERNCALASIAAAEACLEAAKAGLG
jgi:hypothetical protein